MVCTPPYDTRTAIRTVEYVVGNAECGLGGVRVPSQGDQAVLALPGVWGHCPRCPMATLDAEDGVHTT
eukprot:4190101-Prymnesium_polylepis.1